MAEDPATTSSPIRVAEWYGGEERTIEMSSNTAIWTSTGLPAVPLRWVLLRDPQGVFGTQALLYTDLRDDPKQIVSWFVRRWRMEVTFQEVRRHLGFETGKQWSEIAIRRTAPVLLGVFSLIILFAEAQRTHLFTSVRRAAWHDKRVPTFRDALARKELWVQVTFRESHSEADIVKIPRVFMERLTDALCYAA